MPDLQREDRAASARARAAETKRTRSRESLLTAARQLFDSRGWTGTRMEDIAAEAHLSVATAYNHFSSKHAIMATIYAPLLDDLDARARADLAAGASAQDAIRRCVHDFAHLAHDNRALTIALIQSIADATVRGIEPPTSAGRDAPMPAPIADLVEAGQQRGELAASPPGRDVASLLATGLMFRLVTLPAEKPGDAADLALTLLFGALAR